MVGLNGCISQGRPDVIFLKKRVVFKNLRMRGTRAEEAEDVGDADAHSANARPPSALARRYRDSFE